MEVRFPGIGPKLLTDPGPALDEGRRRPTCRCSTGRRRRGARRSRSASTSPTSSSTCPSVRALADRALALDETWSNGALHEMFISLDSLPEALGGSPARAREHFARAVELQKGRSPGPYVALALGIAVPAQDRAEFESLLKTGAGHRSRTGSHNRLVTLVQQRRARALLDHIDTMFTK